MMLYLMNCQILCKAIHIIWRFVDVLLTHMHIQTITGKTCNVVPNPHMSLHENFWKLKGLSRTPTQRYLPYNVPGS